MQIKYFKNPFIYGGRVSADAFCNRERGIKELLEDIHARQHGILSSHDIPRAIDFLLSRESTAYMNTWDLLYLPLCPCPIAYRI